jgi:hypothetical protein
MIHSTAGQIAVNEALPEEMRDYNRVLDKKGVKALLQQVAEKHPDKYKAISHELSQIGQKSAYMTGSHSFDLTHLRTANATHGVRQAVQAGIQQIYSNPSFTQKQKEQAVVELAMSHNEPLTAAILKESKAAGNPLEEQVSAVGRGNPAGLKSLLGSDLLYVDHKDNPIPVPVLRNYSEGMSPVEYYAGTFGARKGVIATKQATQDAGALCLAEGTLVRKADGTEIAIQDLKPGDEVLGSDTSARTFPVKVTAVFNNGNREVWRYRFGTDYRWHYSVTVDCTPNHKVLARIETAETAAERRIHQFADVPVTVPISKASMTTRLVAPCNPETNQKSRPFVFISSATIGVLPTWDIEVDHPDHLFVLANGIIVSNSKQFNQISHRLIVTKHDHEDPNHHAHQGLPVDLDDPDNEGALLSFPIAGYARNTVLRPKVLADLRGKGIKRIVVRSPITTGPIDGGLYGRDVGVRERGGISPKGDNVGIAASQALSEPLTQSQLCLAKGTPVRMADWSLRPIEDVCVGEEVLGADTEGRTFPVRVKNVFDNGIRTCRKFKFRIGLSRETVEVVATPDHKALAIVTGQQKKELQPIGGDFIVFTGSMKEGFSTDEPCTWYYRIGIVVAGDLPTYDLEVEHPDHLFVLGNGLIVANSAKHSGGLVGQAKGISGFALINQLTQVPKTFKGGAAHSRVDGRVGNVEAAPQGGHYVTIEGEKHYVHNDFKPQVKKGDVVEAGDVISDGLPNPSEIVQHKGIGEGRRYFVNAFRNAYKNSGLPYHRRNIEVMARGLIDHVQMTEEHGDYSPDDIVPYNRLEHLYKPREDHQTVAPQKALNMYLEKPVLHYSIGTKIRPSTLRDLNEFGIKQVAVHPKPPPFQPVMIRGMENLSHDPDWMTRFLGSYHERNLLKGVVRGDESDEAGTSYVPSLARGTTFGKVGPTQPWKPKSILQS